MHAPAVVSKIFTDSEEWSAAISDWNLEFRQLDRGPLQASINRVLSPKLVVQQLRLSRRFHQCGFAPDGVLTFGIPEQSDSIKWYGDSAQKRSMMNFNRRNGFDAVSEAGFAASTFSIQSSAFQQEAAALGLPTSVDHVANSAEQYLVSTEDLNRMGAIATALFRITARNVFPENPVKELQNDFVHLLVTSVAKPDALTTKSSHTQRQQAVNRALELVRANTSTSSIAEIYEYAGVSYRTLNRAFKERFGVSPKQYIVAMRLTEVRRALINSQGSVRITDVASDWGFWHLGRFARDYKRMFGELPSESLVNRA